MKKQSIQIIFLVFAVIIAANTATAQKKKPKEARSEPMNEAVLRGDSLVAIECKLPLIDSADDRPTFSLDGKMMVFGSRRPPMKGETWRISSTDPLQPWDGDIYYRLLTDTGWTIPINPGPPVNTSASQNNPTITPRGDEVIYLGGAGSILSRARIIQEELVSYDTIRNARGKVTKVNKNVEIRKTIQPPIAVRGLINNIYSNKTIASMNFQNTIHRKIDQELRSDSDLFKRAPDAREVHRREKLYREIKDNGGAKFYRNFIRCENTITPDGRFAIFAENFGKTNEYGMAGEGDDDLWVAQITSSGNWDTVQAINGKVNSAFAETYPFLAADNTTLYFSSDRPCTECPPGTSGSDDIYMSRLTDTGFTAPVMLPPPFNSPRGDYGFSISPDGKTAYFVSNRTGKSKFYEVHLGPQDSAIAPKTITILSGKVIDKVTKKPVRAQIFIDELTEAKNRSSVYSDSITGQYILTMQLGHRFGMQIVADGYLPRSERYTLPANGSFDRTKLDIELQPVEVGAAAEFKNVYFEFNKSDLLPESKLELDRIVDFLKQSKNTSIEIGGHTDDVGTDDYNEKLSLARASSVMSYLASKGVPTRRMEAKGFGKSKPVVRGSDDDARAKNRRVEMTITAYSN